MKRICLTAGLLLLSLLACAQAKQFKAALVSGRQGFYYKWTNTKDEVLEVEKVKDYAAKNGFILGPVKTKDIARFGAAVTVVASFEFIPANEFAVSFLENKSGKRLESTRYQSATLYYINPEDKTPSVQIMDDVYWNGAASQGRVDGKGVGIKQINPKKLILFDGTYSQGTPQGIVKITTYDLKAPYGEIASGGRDMVEMIYGQKQDDRTWFWFTKYQLYGFVDSDGHIVAPPRYSKVSDFNSGFARVELPRAKGLSFLIDKSGKVYRVYTDPDVSHRDLMRIIKEGDPDVAPYVSDHVKRLYLEESQKLREIDKKAQTAAGNKSATPEGQKVVNDFIANYVDLGYDPDNVAAIAKPLSGYFAICQALDLTPRSSYCDTYADPPVYYGSGDEVILKKGLESCESPSAAFASFAEYAKPILKEKHTKVGNRIGSDYNTYCASMNKRYEEELAKLGKITSVSQIEPLIKYEETIDRTPKNAKDGDWVEVDYVYSFSDIGYLSLVYHSRIGYSDLYYDASGDDFGSPHNFHHYLKSMEGESQNAYFVKVYKNAKQRWLKWKYVYSRAKY